jgi:hypothetical protein
MTRLPRWLVLPLILGLGALLPAGCVAVVAAGAAGGTVAYVRGALQATLDQPVEQVGAAATRAVEQLKFALVSSKVDAVSGEIIARTALDVKVAVALKRVSDRSTSVDIRVGVFGDQAISQQVLEQIKRNL